MGPVTSDRIITGYDYIPLVGRVGGRHCCVEQVTLVCCGDLQDSNSPLPVCYGQSSATVVGGQPTPSLYGYNQILCAVLSCICRINPANSP